MRYSLLMVAVVALTTVSDAKAGLLFGNRGCKTCSGGVCRPCGQPVYAQPACGQPVYGQPFVPQHAQPMPATIPVPSVQPVPAPKVQPVPASKPIPKVAPSPKPVSAPTEESGTTADQIQSSTMITIPVANGQPIIGWSPQPGTIIHYGHCSCNHCISRR